MWIFSLNPEFPKILKSLEIGFTVHKGVNEGTWIPAYHLDEDTPEEKLEKLKAYKGSKE